MKTFYLIIIILLTTIFSACGTGAFDSLSEAEEIPSTSFESFDDDLDGDIPISKTFTARFATEIDPTSVTNETFFVMPNPSASIELSSNLFKTTSDISSCNPSHAIDATVTCSEDKLSCTNTPTGNLDYGSPYLVCLLSSIRFENSAFNGIFEGVSQSFETEEEPADETAPTVSDGTIATSDVSTTEITLAWTEASDNKSDSEDLLYLVFYSATADLDSVADIESNGTAFGDYAEDITSNTVTGLIQNTTYNFNIIVKDEAGNKAIYDPVEASTERDTTGAPTISDGTITADNATGTTIDLSWVEATDDFDDQSTLEYSIYYSTSNNLDSVTNIEANGTEFGSAQAGISSDTVTDLSPSTTYYFNIIVEDSDGNKRNYTSISLATLDEVAPTVGTGITLDKASPVGVRVNWGVASDNLTDTENLQYKVVRAETSEAINTVEEADAISGNDLIMDWTANTTNDYAFCEQATTPYFAVLVKDETGNKSIYEPNQTSALPSAVKKGLVSLSDGSFILMYGDGSDNSYLKSIVFDSSAEYANGPTLVDNVRVGDGQWGVSGRISGVELTNGDIIVSYTQGTWAPWGGWIGPARYIKIDNTGSPAGSPVQYDGGYSEHNSITEIGTNNILLPLSYLSDGERMWPRIYAYNPETNTEIFASGNITSGHFTNRGTSTCSIGTEGDAIFTYAIHGPDDNGSFYAIYDESEQSIRNTTEFLVNNTVESGMDCIPLENEAGDALIIYVDTTDSNYGKMITVDNDGNNKYGITTWLSAGISKTMGVTISAKLLKFGDLAGNIFIAYKGNGDSVGYYTVIDANGNTIASPQVFDTSPDIDIHVTELANGDVAIIYKPGLVIVTPIGD